jgi:hypothetical protein
LGVSLSVVPDGPTPVMWTTTGVSPVGAKCGSRGGSVKKLPAVRELTLWPAEAVTDGWSMHDVPLNYLAGFLA